MQSIEILYPYEQTVMYHVHRWENWSQLSGTLHHYQKVAQQAETPLNVIYLFDKHITIPQPCDLAKVREFIDTNQIHPERTVLVNAPRALSVFIRMMQQLYEDVWESREMQYIFVDSLEEAATRLNLSVCKTGSVRVR